VLLIILLSIFAGCKKNKPAKKTKAVISYIQNDVEKNQSSGWIKAKILDILQKEAGIKTGAQSQTGLLFSTGHKVVILEKTLCYLKTVSEELTSFNLESGNIYSKIKSLKAGSSFSVETPSVSVGVRGTEFLVISGEKFDKIAVKTGRISVTLKLNSQIEKALNHKNGKIKSLGIYLKKGISISPYKSVTILKVRLEKIKSSLADILKLTTDKEILKAVDKIKKLAAFEITDANDEDFTGYQAALKNIINKKGAKSVVLDGANGETLISINGKTAGRGYISTLLKPGSYTFLFNLYNVHKKSFDREYKYGEKDTDIIKAPFENLKRPAALPERFTPYSANAPRRIAN
jgi:hypothetical protein